VISINQLSRPDELGTDDGHSATEFAVLTVNDALNLLFQQIEFFASVGRLLLAIARLGFDRQVVQEGTEARHEQRQDRDR